MTTSSPETTSDTAYIHQVPYVLGSIVASFTGTIGTTLVLLIHGFFTYQSWKNRQKLMKKSKSAHMSRNGHSSINYHTLITYSTFTTFFCFTFFGWWVSVYKVAPLSSLSCDWEIKLGASMYHLGKSLMYLVLILRLKVAFGTSNLAYSHRVIFGLAASVLLYATIIFIADLVYARGDSGTVNDSSLTYCNTLLPEGLLFGTAIVDFVLAMLTLYLFVYRLRKVLAESSSSQSQVRIKALLMKYTLLTVISVLSTIIMMFIVAVTHGAGYVMLDVLINVMCIAFLSSYYNKAFSVCCGAGFRSVECCCNRCCEVKVQIDMQKLLSLKSAVNEGSKNSNMSGNTNMSGNKESGNKESGNKEQELSGNKEQEMSGNKDQEMSGNNIDTKDVESVMTNQPIPLQELQSIQSRSEVTNQEKEEVDV